MFISANYNFERKYLLSKHLESDKKRVYASGEIKLLFAETGNRCGNCNKPLDWNLSDSINSKKNQIAHIYGKKLFAKAKLPLKEKYHISDVSEINQYHNLIILCDECHFDYDHNPTYEKYRKILEVKEHVAKNVSNKRFIYFALEDILENIKQGAFSSIIITEGDNINGYKKSELISKLEFNNINNLKATRVVTDMVLYFKIIKEQINDLGKEKDYLKKYNDVYLQLKNLYKNKNEILNIIDNSLIETDYNIFADIIPIITSYMIMNCEVLDNVTK